MQISKYICYILAFFIRDILSIAIIIIYETFIKMSSSSTPFSTPTEHIGLVVRCRFWIQKVDGWNTSINMFSPCARDFIRIASVDSAVKLVPGGDNLVKGVQCYELFGGIALKNHAFSFSFH